MTNLAFLHIPRVGGTSYRYGLRDCPDYQEVDSGIGTKPDPSKKLILGHFPFGYVEADTYFVMLRDPVERGLSEYRMARKSYDPHWLPAFPENAQTRYLAGRELYHDPRPVDENDYHLALENLETCIVGFTRTYQKSFEVFKSLCVSYGIRLSESFVPLHENRSLDMNVPLDVVDAVQRDSYWDSKLYNYAWDKFGLL